MVKIVKIDTRKVPPKVLQRFLAQQRQLPSGKTSPVVPTTTFRGGDVVRQQGFNEVIFKVPDSFDVNKVRAAAEAFARGEKVSESLQQEPEPQIVEQEIPEEELRARASQVAGFTPRERPEPLDTETAFQVTAGGISAVGGGVGTAVRTEARGGFTPVEGGEGVAEITTEEERIKQFPTLQERFGTGAAELSPIQESLREGVTERGRLLLTSFFPSPTPAAQAAEFATSFIGTERMVEAQRFGQELRIGLGVGGLTAIPSTALTIAALPTLTPEKLSKGLQAEAAFALASPGRFVGEQLGGAIAFTGAARLLSPLKRLRDPSVRGIEIGGIRDIGKGIKEVRSRAKIDTGEIDLLATFRTGFSLSATKGRVVTKELGVETITRFRPTKIPKGGGLSDPFTSLSRIKVTTPKGKLVGEALSIGEVKVGRGRLVSVFEGPGGLPVPQSDVLRLIDTISPVVRDQIVRTAAVQKGLRGTGFFDVQAFKQLSLPKRRLVLRLGTEPKTGSFFAGLTFERGIRTEFVLGERTQSITDFFALQKGEFSDILTRFVGAGKTAGRRGARGLTVSRIFDVKEPPTIRIPGEIRGRFRIPFIEEPIKPGRLKPTTTGVSELPISGGISKIITESTLRTLPREILEEAPTLPRGAALPIAIPSFDSRVGELTMGKVSSIESSLSFDQRSGLRSGLKEKPIQESIQGTFSGFSQFLTGKQSGLDITRITGQGIGQITQPRQELKVGTGLRQRLSFIQRQRSLLDTPQLLTLGSAIAAFPPIFGGLDDGFRVASRRKRRGKRRPRRFRPQADPLSATFQELENVFGGVRFGFVQPRPTRRVRRAFVRRQRRRGLLFTFPTQEQIGRGIRL